MKVRKVLALVLALLIVCGVSAFAAEPGQPAEGEPGAGGSAAAGGQEQAATQAFERSLSVKGAWLWRYEYIGKKNASNVKDVSQHAWNLLHLNLVYNISPNLKLHAALYWGASLGNNRDTFGYQPGMGVMSDTLGLNLSGHDGGAGYDYINNGTIGNTTTFATVDPHKIEVKQLFVSWKIGGALGTVSIGRMDAMWANGSVFFGPYQGADRIKWVGKLKLGGYMALPILILELRRDPTDATNDQSYQVIPGFVMVGPGKTLEQLWVAFGAFIPSRAAGLDDAQVPYNGTVTRAKWYLLDIYAKLRFGSVVLNVELIGGIGSTNKTYVNGVLQDDEKGIKFLGLALHGEMKFGFVTITPKIMFLTAADPNANNGQGSAGYLTFQYDNIYSGTLLSTALINPFNNGNLGVGYDDGMFAFSVKAAFTFGKLTVWLKPALQMIISDYGIAAYGAKYDGSKILGFEIDFGVDVTLADGFTMMFEFAYLMPMGPIADDTTDDLAGLTGLSYKSIYGMYLKFDLTF